tara:strand:+ start:1388 stop:1555 length:168 start_codon:yes stop_codon:yes gene_type:complete
LLLHVLEYACFKKRTILLLVQAAKELLTKFVIGQFSQINKEKISLLSSKVDKFNK